MDWVGIEHQAYLDANLEAPVLCELASGEAALFVSRAPEREGANEDSIALLRLDDRRALLLIADGFGGCPSGGEASSLAIAAVADSVRESVAETPDASGGLAGAILAGFDGANAAVLGLGVGAATTLVAVELWDDWIRPYHVGDSEVLVTGQRGLVKLRTTAHSPIGYAVEAGLVHADDAIHHEERHLVSNMVGAKEMRVEVGAPLRLARFDTLVVGSDGLFDNLNLDEIVEIARKGPIGHAAAELASLARQRMEHPEPGLPSKPDDLSFIVYRMRGARSRPAL